MEFRKEIPLMLVALSLLVGCGDRPFIKPEANDESMIIVGAGHLVGPDGHAVAVGDPPVAEEDQLRRLL